MKMNVLILTYEVEIEDGEPFTVPAGLDESLGPGRWRITIQPIAATANGESAVRGHDAFLNAYAPEDEGLYDDCPPG
jgi:hypothetical protein